MIAKLLIFILMMSILNCIIEIWNIVFCFIKENKYEITTLRKILFMASIAFILTIIIMGI